LAYKGDLNKRGGFQNFSQTNLEQKGEKNLRSVVTPPPPPNYVSKISD